jgi:hypothetical protein
LKGLESQHLAQVTSANFFRVFGKASAPVRCG